MRTYYDINLNTKETRATELHGEDIVKAGRYLIAKKLNEAGVATVDPLGPDNPLIFSAGPFAGSSFSNANRTSVGCKSPLTGGIKEANGGGTFSYALGQLEISGFTLHGQCDEWSILHFHKDGSITFSSAEEIIGMGTLEAAATLHAKFGKKISLGLIGPVGEYEGLLAGISFSDSDRRPTRLAARGGVGAVMGSKKIKAIIVDMKKMPTFHDRKKVLSGLKEYASKLNDSPLITGFFQRTGTMGMSDIINQKGGLPVKNFSLGRVELEDGEVFKMGGDFIRDQNNERGGKHTHACMPGCVIQCSNVYVDADGNEIVSPVEYETIGLLGTNLGIKDPDDLALLNGIANDLGVDTIEAGAMLGVVLDQGLAEWGDMEFLTNALDVEIRNGTEIGKIWAQGTAVVGEHYGAKRVPVIKRQGISAYDPRVIEVTGITMMTTAQGADHTAGNVASYASKDKDVAHLLEVSLNKQIDMAYNDSLGLCIFGGSVTGPNLEFVANTINGAHNTAIDPAWFTELGKETLRLERAFNVAAGFTAADDELPAFFYSDAINETDDVARFHGEDVFDVYASLGVAVSTGGKS